MPQTRNKNRIRYLSFIAFTICSLANAGAIVLDDYDSDPNNDALGHRATFNGSIISDPFSQGGNVELDTAFASDDDIGAVFMNSGVGVQQRLSMRYNLNQGPLDLLSSGNTTLEFDFLEVDQDFTIRIVMLGSFGGKAVTSSLLVEAGSNQTTSVDIVNGFDFFAMDLSSVTSFEVIFNNTHRDDVGDFVNTPSLDFVLTEMRAVPAPSALSLIGLSGLAILRRKR